MSRGLGAVERRILGLLADEDLPRGWLVSFPRTDLVALRRAMPDVGKGAMSRALRSLWRKGLIVAEVGQGAPLGRSPWGERYIKVVALSPDGARDKWEHEETFRLLSLKEREDLVK